LSVGIAGRVFLVFRAGRSSLSGTSMNSLTGRQATKNLDMRFHNFGFRRIFTIRYIQTALNKK